MTGYDTRPDTATDDLRHWTTDRLVAAVRTAPVLPADPPPVAELRRRVADYERRAEQ